MTIGRICTRIVSTAGPDESVWAVAGRMAEHRVGTLVVLDEHERPMGFLTDRDIVVRCVAGQLDVHDTPVGAVMSEPARSVPESTPIEDAIALMANKKERRLVVTDPEGRLVGVVALDDVLELLAEELNNIGRLVRRE